jgi:hypothetical protein
VLLPLCQYIRGHAAQALSGLELTCGHLARLAILLKFESQLLTFNDRAHPSAFNGRDVNENVGAAVVRLNEAEALGGVKPFYCASGHEQTLSSHD